MMRTNRTALFSSSAGAPSSSRVPPARRLRASTVLLASLSVCVLAYGVALSRLDILPLVNETTGGGSRTPQPPKLTTFATTKTVAPQPQPNDGINKKPRKRFKNKIPVFGADRAKSQSSVDYITCCGLGHRMSRMSDAHYLAKLLRFGLRAFWGYCDATEVFHHLFGPQPLDELVNVTDRFQSVRVNNDVPGFWKLVRKGSNETCSCSFEKAKEDVRFYQGLRSRFHLKHVVDSFRREHFTTNATVIGMHIRAGNGEKGHFTSRNRAIANETEWTRNVVDQLLQAGWGPSPILFVATDTPSMVVSLRKLLDGAMKVITHNQKARQPGTGVMFGERGKVVNTGKSCLGGWENSVIDMILLSHADVVVAARPSSFVQSLPMSLALSTPKESRKTSHSYCEFNPSGTAMQCYEDYKEWCCVGTTSFSLAGMQPTDYLRMPPTEKVDQKKLKMSRRGPRDCLPKPEGWKQTCLPYDWANPQ